MHRISLGKLSLLVIVNSALRPLFGVHQKIKLIRGRQVPCSRLAALAAEPSSVPSSSEFAAGVTSTVAFVAVPVLDDGVGLLTLLTAGLRGLAAGRFAFVAAGRFELARAGVAGLAFRGLAFSALIFSGRASATVALALRFFEAPARALGFAVLFAVLVDFSFFVLAAGFAALAAAAAVLLAARRSCFHALRAVVACLRARRASRFASFKRLRARFNSSFAMRTRCLATSAWSLARSTGSEVAALLFSESSAGVSLPVFFIRGPAK
jgi:hypothetical protein